MSNVLLHRWGFQQIIDLWLLDVLALESSRTFTKTKCLRSEIQLMFSLETELWNKFFFKKINGSAKQGLLLQYTADQNKLI